MSVRTRGASIRFRAMSSASCASSMLLRVPDAIQNRAAVNRVFLSRKPASKISLWRSRWPPIACAFKRPYSALPGMRVHVFHGYEPVLQPVMFSLIRYCGDDRLRLPDGADPEELPPIYVLPGQR